MPACRWVSREAGGTVCTFYELGVFGIRAVWALGWVRLTDKTLTGLSGGCGFYTYRGNAVVPIKHTLRFALQRVTFELSFNQITTLRL